MESGLAIRYAPEAFRLLRGVLCVYKPSGIKDGTVKYSLLTKLCNELNEMECRPPMDYVEIEGDTTKEMSVTVRPNYADHPLVVGPRYQETDIKCTLSLPLGVHTSGVMLLGLHKGHKIVTALKYAHQLRTFHITGQFGRATDTMFTDGKVVERSKFMHVTRPRLDKHLAAIQAAHQRSAFELAGLDIQSQDAYELAAQGLVRPADPNVPMIYGIKCVDFNLPNFTVEVHCTNEHEMYLKTLIHEIGLKLHTNAVCTKIRCIRNSVFTLENALLRKHWTLQHVISNLAETRRILRANRDFYSGLLKQAELRDPAKTQVVA